MPGHSRLEAVWAGSSWSLRVLPALRSNTIWSLESIFYMNPFAQQLKSKSVTIYAAWMESPLYHLFSSNVGSSKQQRRRAPTSETEPSSASGASSCADVESKHLPYSSFNFQRLPASLAIWFGVTKASTWSFAMQRDLLLLETHPTNPRRCSTLSLSVAAKKSNRPGSSSCSWRIPIVWKHRRLCHAASASLRKTNVDIFGSWPSNGSVCFETV